MTCSLSSPQSLAHGLGHRSCSRNICECFVFFYEMVGQMWPQEKRLRETTFIVLTGARDGRPGMHPTGQKTAGRGRLRPWPSLGFLWERQGSAVEFHMGYFEELPWALGYRGGPYLSGTWPWRD